MNKLVVLLSVISFLACQKAELKEEKTSVKPRSVEVQSDSTDVNVETDTKDWEGAVDVEFSIEGRRNE